MIDSSASKYVDNILRKAKDKSYHVLAEIYLQYNHTNDRWHAIKENKEVIKTNLSISTSTLDKHIKSLKDRNILISVTKGIYRVEAIPVYDIE